MDDLEMLLSEAFDDDVVTEVIRPAAVLPEDAARSVLMEMALRDVRVGGYWWSEPSIWKRYDRAWTDEGESQASLLGKIEVAYGVPTRYEITIFRATITQLGQSAGLTVQQLCDEALGYGGLSLATCPRADLQPPPRPFRFTDRGYSL